MNAETSITLYTRSFDTKDTKEMPLATARWLVDTLGLAQWRGWFEPFPALRPDGRAGRADFHPWRIDWPSPAETPELAEIRIGGYLPDGRIGGCHLVQDEDGTVRWFAFAETYFDGATATPKKVKKNAYPALQRRDGERRFFVDDPAWLKNTGHLDLVEYWQGERLLAWLVVDSRG